ncbi:MAG TPA: diguanylate cyclase, partial [Gammaproteobacteria bacterium]
DSGNPGVVEVGIKGLYEVRLDFMDGLRAAERAEVLAAAEEVLQANRNLCEDFVGFTEVASEDWLICGEFDLEADVEIAEVKAQILFQVQDYLAPAVANYSLEEMLRKRKADGSPYRSEDIFNGPRLKTGFIVDEELSDADLRSEVRLSDIISIVMDIRGVIAVRDLQVNPHSHSGPLQNKWVVKVADGARAHLRMADSRLVFYKRDMPMAARDDAVEARFDALVAEARAKLETDISDQLDLPMPLGRYRNPQAYYAFQNHLPLVYGIGEAGLPANAGPERIAQARQLKAYLLFFEQLLADFLSQLGHLRELLSTAPDLLHADFRQLVDSFVDWQLIYGGAEGADENERRQIVGQLIDALGDGGHSLERRNRFLDHLIARYAEQFDELANIMYSSFGVGPQVLARYKCKFLDNYPVISAERGLAYNYGLDEPADIWNSDNISGLEKRLARLLGIDNPSRRNLGDVAYDIYAEIDATPGDEFRFRIRNRDDGDILLSSSRNFVTRDQARAEMRRAIVYGSQPVNYRSKVGSNGKHYFNVVDDSEHILASRRQGFDDEAQLQQAIDEVIEYLRVNYSEEGMYLIENILLRPEQTDDPFLPICVDANCEDCAEADPYSYRIQIILPAYGVRFRDQEYRAYAERLIRAEVPAHILPKICWISKQDMAVVEKAY